MARALSPRQDPFGAPAGRALGIALVVALHIALVYALVTGMARRAIETVRAPVIATILPPPEPEHPAPPPPPPPPAPPPQVAPPPLFVPPPHVAVPKPRPRPTAPTVVMPTPPSPAPAPAPVITAPPAPPRAPVMTEPRLDLAHSREPDYPAISRRLGEQGALMVQVLVDETGRPREVKLLQSSGYPRLDQAALAGIKESYRFVPGTADGKPEPTWVTFKFIWKLR